MEEYVIKNQKKLRLGITTGTCSAAAAQAAAMQLLLGVESHGVTLRTPKGMTVSVPVYLLESDSRNKFPSQLSGGQQQRCAIARALIKNPKLLLCDEPTGALDSRTSRDILILLEKINAQYGTTMIIVTHNNAIKDMVDQVIVLKDGQIKKNYNNETKVPAAELEDL